MALHLLDVNALIALGWNGHQHHEAMLAWFKRHARQGWATCAITQAGFVRILSQPALGEAASTIAELADTLALNLAHKAHRLLPLDFDFAEVRSVCTGGVVGHRQITDAYLLTAATRAGGRLLTFDRSVSQLLATEAERQRQLLVMA